MEGSINAVSVGVAVGLVLGLELLVWGMETFTFLEERAALLVSFL